jgi:hypothetical protein
MEQFSIRISTGLLLAGGWNYLVRLYRPQAGELKK